MNTLHHPQKQEQEQVEEGEARHEWDLSLSTVVSSTSSSASDVVGAIEFDPTDNILATAGISRKIRFYGLPSLLRTTAGVCGGGGVSFLDQATACEYYICTPAKLSSLRWRPGSCGRVIGSGDYDGVVTEYDLEKRTPVFERDEHGGRRVWSVDYTRHGGSAAVGASGSDDGTMQVWDPRCPPEESVGVVRPAGLCRSAVCCVEFDPSGGPAVAVGCADRRGYVYDMRKLVDPALTLQGHTKTVSYVRFLDGGTVVTAGTDGCLKLWSVEDGRVIRTYEGHVNNRNFVGLSVWRNGALFGCGSENNRVFVYDRRWRKPVWVDGFEPVSMTSGSDKRFVSSVCWRQSGVDQCTLVAGGSDGVLQVYVGKRKP
ncbi:hypothetical protein Bca4012_067573 [Brassica carinata]|uniref:Uncharacterized protein n=2 Tax=Brassica carinata TaxID=52824 RepID=A0A8X7VRL8_BRACI|nr:hypothetical protein Bca52824_019850 [Brassica carinata]